MHEFHSIAHFIQHLTAAGAKEALSCRRALEQAAKAVEAQAKLEIGHYQDAVGDFPAWTALAEATMEDRVSRGYPANEPLLRSGAMRDSISHQIDGLVAAIGSNSDIALWQELGTPTIPPRPFLGTALVQKEKQIARLIGDYAAGALAGTQVTPRLQGPDD